MNGNKNVEIGNDHLVVEDTAQVSPATPPNDGINVCNNDKTASFERPRRFSLTVQNIFS